MSGSARCTKPQSTGSRLPTAAASTTSTMSHTNAPDELDVSGSPLDVPLDESSLEPLDAESESDDVDSVACVIPVDDSDPVEADPVLVSAPPGPESSPQASIARGRSQGRARCSRSIIGALCHPL